MFKLSVAETPFTTSAADDFFNNITGEDFIGDSSFVATLRALVTPRMQSEDHLRLYFANSRMSEDSVNSSPASAVVSTVFDEDEYPDEGRYIIIHNLRSVRQADNLAVIECLKRNFTSRNRDGWVLLDKVTEFYRKSFNVICFINPNIRAVTIFVDLLDLRKLHYLQCSIFAFLPWYFDPAAGVSPIEMELIQSLREKTSDAYLACLCRMAEQYDFRAAKIRRLLAGFETRYEETRCAEVRNQLARYIDAINQYNREIEGLLGSMRESEIELLGLETKIASGSEESEIMDYFMCNKRLVLESVSGSYMDFVVKDYLSYFDEEMAKRCIDNENSFVYRPDGNRDVRRIIPPDKMKRLLYAIFIDQKLKLKICAAYRFKLNGSVQALSHHSFGWECRDFMPNPHINRYSCMGNYSRTINNLLVEHNYIGAIEQCIASCKSLNFGDSTVMTEFMRTLYGTSSNNYNNCCIELPDGSVVKPVDAVLWLDQQDGITGSEEAANE